MTVSPPAAESLGPTVIPRVDEFIDAPRAIFGRNLDEIQKRLGRSNAGTSLELIYPGVTIRLARSHALQRVVITSARFRLPLGLDVGVSRARVEEVLGEPQEATDIRSMYLYSDGFPDTVEFSFKDGAVHRIEWSYSTDVPSQ